MDTSVEEQLTDIVQDRRELRYDPRETSRLIVSAFSLPFSLEPDLRSNRFISLSLSPREDKIIKSFRDGATSAAIDRE